MMMSSASSSGTRSAITPSTGLPALTMTMIRRGRSSAWTNSSSDSHAVKSPSAPYSDMKSFVLLAVRLWTAIGTPRRAMLRARFAPITASPVTPIWLIAEDSTNLPIIAPPAVSGSRRVSRPDYYGNPAGLTDEADVVRAFYDAFARRDIDAALHVTSPDCELDFAGTARLAGRSEPYHGHQ